MDNYDLLAKKYIQMGKEFLSEYYDTYHGKTTGMDTDEDTKDENYRLNLENEILKDDSVSRCWWEKEDYGYTLWIEF